MTKVLIVEDDRWFADGHRARLEAAGYDVAVAAHAHEAIALVDATLPDVIVMDVLLAASTAFALLHELQSYTDTGLIPVVLCSNVADQFDAVSLAPYGVRRVLDKTTMHPDDIVAAVKACL